MFEKQRNNYKRKIPMHKAERGKSNLEGEFDVILLISIQSINFNC